MYASNVFLLVLNKVSVYRFMQRKNVSSGTHWESIVGYSRAVRVGDFVFVSGTTATDKEGSIIGIGNPYLQNIQIIKNIQIALQMVGGYLKDVVRTRIYITDINNWEKSRTGSFRILRTNLDQPATLIE